MIALPIRSRAGSNVNIPEILSGRLRNLPQSNKGKSQLSAFERAGDTPGAE